MLLSTPVVWPVLATSWPELLERDTLNSNCSISPASASWARAAPSRSFYLESLVAGAAHPGE